MIATLIAAVALIGSGAATKCNPPDNYFTAGVVSGHAKTVGKYQGLWQRAVDSDNKRILERNEGLQYNSYIQLDWMTNMSYSVTDNQQCLKADLANPWQAPWAWIDLAKFEKRELISGRMMDVWRLSISGIELSIACPDNDATAPAWMRIVNQFEKMDIEILRFIGGTPEKSVWDLPKQCK